LIVIKNRIFIGTNSYPYRYIFYTFPSFNNNIITYLLPLLALNRIRVNSLDLLYALI
ncbi:uncharacterized protein K441DRAFT_538186, partial [Cenococcum geophilum 1.58]|uniref:uncharacterized protein n=1 Tax=Cenococcum geophilum 1.58 TaxID=794803 RepID=UPI00358FF0F8